MPGDSSAARAGKPWTVPLLAQEITGSKLRYINYRVLIQTATNDGERRMYKKSFKAALQVFFVMSAIFAQQASADGEILIARNIPYATDDIGNASIRAECDWTRTLSENIINFSKGKITGTDQKLDALPGKVLDIKVVRVHAFGGGAYSGSKWASIHGDLIESGKIIRSFDFTRITTFSFHITACGSLGKISSALAKDVNKWVINADYRSGIQPPDTQNSNDQNIKQENSQN
jgi:hypothetical protein